MIVAFVASMVGCTVLSSLSLLLNGFTFANDLKIGAMIFGGGLGLTLLAGPFIAAASWKNTGIHCTDLSVPGLP